MTHSALRVPSGQIGSETGAAFGGRGLLCPSGNAETSKEKESQPRSAVIGTTVVSIVLDVKKIEGRTAICGIELAGLLKLIRGVRQSLCSS